MRRAVARAALALAALLAPGVSAGAQTVAVVGPGAASCARILAEGDDEPGREREAFAWAQGYMSAVLLTAPLGIDDDLDITPATMPIIEQMAFLRTYCAAQPEADYVSAVNALYRRLGGRALR